MHGIQNYVKLSVDHITIKDIYILEDKELWFVICDYEEGLILHIPEPDPGIEFIKEVRDYGLSESFVKVVKHCIMHDANMLVLDRNGELLSSLDYDLDTHDW